MYVFMLKFCLYANCLNAISVSNNLSTLFEFSVTNTAVFHVNYFAYYFPLYAIKQLKIYRIES